MTRDQGHSKEGVEFMKGFMRKAATVLGGALALAGSQGCYEYRQLVDPCWPQRYNYEASKCVDANLTPQVQNGHVLDQTIWNWMFEAGTDKLTAGGLEHLSYLARRRPHPDCTVYVQTAQDVAYDAAAPDKMAADREELDNKRKVAIMKFLGAQTAGRPSEFQVLVHDPADVYLPAIAANVAYNQWVLTRPRGGLATSGGAGGGLGAGGGGGAGGLR
jgi:hypothetical protein